MPITFDFFPNVSTLIIFLLIGVNVFETQEKGFPRVGEMNFGALDTFFSLDIFFTTLFDFMDSLTLLFPSPRSTTCIWGLLGRSNVALMDGIGLLWGESHRECSVL